LNVLFKMKDEFKDLKPFFKSYWRELHLGLDN